MPFRRARPTADTRNERNGRRFATVVLLARDYGEAVRWLVDKTRFELVEDTDPGDGKRWVVVAPENGGARLLLAKAADECHKRELHERQTRREASHKRLREQVILDAKAAERATKAERWRQENERKMSAKRLEPVPRNAKCR